jgi:hypothetical protein
MYAASRSSQRPHATDLRHSRVPQWNESSRGFLSQTMRPLLRDRGTTRGSERTATQSCLDEDPSGPSSPFCPAGVAHRISATGTHIPGNILATSISSNVSHLSGKPNDSDDLDAGAPIYAASPRLRALWTVWSVEVRVLSGASKSPANNGFRIPGWHASGFTCRRENGGPDVP